MKTKNFKIEIGHTFKDNKRDITIIDREYRQSPYNKNSQLKYYKYHCNKCGYEDWKIESKLLSSGGCPCCLGRVVVEGINDIPTTAPWMVKYFQGGYEEAKKYTYNSRTKIYPICPCCGSVKDIPIYIYSIFNNKSIGCCCNNNNTSLPERFIIQLLKQLLGNQFIYQYLKSNAKWVGKYKYDFYFEYNNEKYIIEANGEQHYTNSFKRKGSKTLEEEKQNDLNKYNLAIKNGIKPKNYIVIDCRESNPKFIKDSIINSRLNVIFDLNKIDWNECGKKMLTKDMIEVINIKNKNKMLTTIDIGKIVNKNSSTVRDYLKIGDYLGLCIYNKEYEKLLHNNNVAKSIISKFGKKIICIENNIIFESMSELCRESEKYFSVKISMKKLRNACNNNLDINGYHFKYYDKEISYEELQTYKSKRGTGALGSSGK